eukprot:COSAG04_NODE_10_length_43369_cov_4.059025_20_plen_33_part_00
MTVYMEQPVSESMAWVQPFAPVQIVPGWYSAE